VSKEKIVKKQEDISVGIPPVDDLLKKSSVDTEIRHKIDGLLSKEAGIVNLGILPDGQVSFARYRYDTGALHIPSPNPKTTTIVRIETAERHFRDTGRKPESEHLISIHPSKSEELDWNPDAFIAEAARILIHRLGFNGTTECIPHFKSEFSLATKAGRTTLEKVAELNIPREL